MNAWNLWFLVTAIALVAASATHADIYEWEYIDPSNPSLGSQQSKVLAPEGEGLVPRPGMIAEGKNLTMAYLVGANITRSTLTQAELTDADFSSAVLAKSYAWQAIFTNADLSNADLTNAYFGYATLNNSDLSHTIARRSVIPRLL